MRSRCGASLRCSSPERFRLDSLALGGRPCRRVTSRRLKGQRPLMPLGRGPGRYPKGFRPSTEAGKRLLAVMPGAQEVPYRCASFLGDPGRRSSSFRDEAFRFALGLHKESCGEALRVGEDVGGDVVGEK